MQQIAQFFYVFVWEMHAPISQLPTLNMHYRTFPVSKLQGIEYAPASSPNKLRYFQAISLKCTKLHHFSKFPGKQAHTSLIF